jgi:hypothetical protein
MKLVYIDPGCSGLQIVDCKKGTQAEVRKILEENSISEDTCSDVVYCAVIDGDKVNKFEVDFS